MTTGLGVSSSVVSAMPPLKDARKYRLNLILSHQYRPARRAAPVCGAGDGEDARCLSRGPAGSEDPGRGVPPGVLGRGPRESARLRDLPAAEQGQTGLTFKQVQHEVKKHQLKQIAGIISLIMLIRLTPNYPVGSVSTAWPLACGSGPDGSQPHSRGQGSLRPPQRVLGALKAQCRAPYGCPLASMLASSLQPVVSFGVNRISMSLIIPVDDRLFMAGMLGDQADDAAQREIDDRADQIVKRLPNERTGLRIRAFYVDPGKHE